MRKRNGKKFIPPKEALTPPHMIIDDYKELLTELRVQNDSAHILISAIIPRYFDWDRNKNHLVYVNNELRNLTTLYPNSSFIPTYKCVLKGGKAMQQYYNSDGLHLSQDHGVINVKRLFQRKIMGALKLKT